MKEIKFKFVPKGIEYTLNCILPAYKNTLKFVKNSVSTSLPTHFLFFCTFIFAASKSDLGRLVKMEISDRLSDILQINITDLFHINSHELLFCIEISANTKVPVI